MWRAVDAERHNSGAAWLHSSPGRLPTGRDPRSGAGHYRHSSSMVTWSLAGVVSR
jgi:hypothetical protein